jgi:hypothetical protein
MRKITLTIEITDEEFDALKKVKEEKLAEFRDSEFSWEEYYIKHKEVVDNKPDVWTEQRFLNRNFGGLRKEVLSLHDKGLVELSEDAWHLTFEISDLGDKFFLID